MLPRGTPERVDGKNPCADLPTVAVKIVSWDVGTIPARDYRRSREPDDSYEPAPDFTPEPMADPLLIHDGELVSGTIIDRPNRFVVRVDFDGEPKRVFLGDPGELAGIVEPGQEVLCSPVDDESRATDYDAIAALVGGTHVSLRAALANDLFARALTREYLEVPEHETVVREPPLPDHGRTDFRLDGPDGPRAYVEVKSCTSVADGVARFPDRPTERGRRHLRSLQSLAETGVDCQVVFVVQRPDAEALEPYREVDPEFADLLARVSEAGVQVRALSTAFDPPHYYLREPNLPVRLG